MNQLMVCHFVTVDSVTSTIMKHKTIKPTLDSFEMDCLISEKRTGGGSSGVETLASKQEVTKKHSRPVDLMTVY